MKKIITLSQVVLALSWLSAGGRATAEDIPALPEIVVTAMRYGADPATIPYTTHIVGEAERASQLPRTTPDALSGLPSVMVQKTSYGQGSPFMRGFTGFRTLMMVDGIRLNNSVFRDGPNQYWNTVDPYSIDRYEVVMGPASVLYGSDAIGGAVNALTLAPLAWSGQPVWSPRLEYRGATADESTQVRGGLAGRVSENLGLTLGATWKDFGDIKGGDEVGRQPRTGYDEVAYDGRVDYTFGGGAVLTLAHQHVDQDDAWRTHRTIYGIDWKGLKHGDDLVHSFDQQRTLTYARLEDGELGGEYVDAYRLTLSRQEQVEDLYRVRNDSSSDRQGFDVTTWGVSLELESMTSAGRLVYGADYYEDRVDSYARRYKDDGSLKSTAIQGPVADDAAYRLLGLFVQDTIEIGSGGTLVTPGARYTRAELDADRMLDPASGEATAKSDDWDEVTGSLRLLQPFGEEDRRALFAGLSQGFRAPNLSDLTRLDIARSNEIETPVDDLSPEQFVSLEIGARARGEGYTAEAAWYYTWIDDLIVRTPTGREIDGAAEVTKRNSGRGFVQGVELMVSYDVTEAWQVRLSGTWMEGEADTYSSSSAEKTRDYLSRVMPLTGQLALRWTPGQTFWIEAVFDAAGDADKLAEADKRDTQRIPPGGTPGYVVCALRSHFMITDSVSLSLTVENLTDEDYRIHGSGVNEPGRQLVAGLSCAF